MYFERKHDLSHNNAQSQWKYTDILYRLINDEWISTEAKTVKPQ